MRTASRLPSRVQRLEAQLPPLNDKASFDDRLIAYRIIYFTLYHKDRGDVSRPAVRETLQHVMKTLKADEQQLRQIVHNDLEEFGAYIQQDPEWCPLTGFDEAVRERHRQEQARLDRRRGSQP